MDAAENSGGADGLGEDLVGAHDAEAFFAEDADDGGEEAVIAGEGGAADSGHDAGALGIGAEVEPGGAADGADEDEVGAALAAEGGEDGAGGADADFLVGIGGDYGGIGEAA